MKKTLKTPQANDEWKDHLRASSMKIGFSISLSRAMLELLCAVSDGVQWDRALYRLGATVPENWIASQRSLVKRGLIGRKDDDEIEAMRTIRLPQIDREQWYEFNYYKLTPAGESVVSLLKMAGMFVEADAAINKKARRA